jgi:ATP-dependent helicase/nuclease subunit B
MSRRPVLLVPHGAPFADTVAGHLVAEHCQRLPDLSGLTLVVAHLSLAAPLRAALARAAGGALLAPRIVTLQQLAAAARPAEAPPPRSALACRLQLAEWLTRLRNVFPDRDPMAVADALFELFEDLALSAVRLPDTVEAFAVQLQAAYAAPELAALSREAALVHALWRPYTEEIGDRAPAVAHLRDLRAATLTLADAILIGHDRLSPAEGALLAPLLADGRLRLWVRARSHGQEAGALATLLNRLHVTGSDCEIADAPPSPRRRLLDAWLDHSAEARPFADRAGRLAGSGPVGIRMAVGASPEHEARIVALAVREALLAGHQRIVVVSGDRRLARRLRALLERANIALDDRVGWRLSTSRAAATLAAWLDAVEGGFHHRPLRDVLKSGFFVGEPVERPEPLLAARLEQALHFPPRDAARPPVTGLAAFSVLADGRWPALFERLQRAAAELPVSGPARLASDWADAVLASIASVGLAAGLADDDAGSQLVSTVRKVRGALAGLPLRLGWAGFRALLDREIEAATFRPLPGVAGPRVRLVTLDATAGLDADFIVLASATRAQLPGSAPGAVLFNEAVRRELGLDGWADRQRLMLARLRDLLDAGREVRVTWAAERDDEPAQPSPWLEALAAFAEAAGFDPLDDAALAARARDPATERAPLDAVDAVPVTRPAPPAPAALLPGTLSASGHQALVDCPYRWYAGRVLGLSEAADPDEDSGPRDYGDRVHRILAAFHQSLDPALPPPYAGPRDAAHVDAVLAHLRRIADAVFAPDLRLRPMAAIWSRAFAAVAPWLAARIVERGTAAVSVEQDIDVAAAGWQLKGRADRIERGADGVATVVDYKSGRVPKDADVLAGETVQLVHYALALGRTEAIEYWGLRETDDDDRRRVRVEAEDLHTLGLGIETRLAALRDALARGHALPAHGVRAVCQHCEHAGLCRRASWPAEAMP